MTSRLAQTHPRIEEWLAAQPPEERLDAAQRLARAAAHRAGLTVPLDTDLSAWAEQVDRRGWTQGIDGTWEQSADDFVRLDQPA